MLREMSKQCLRWISITSKKNAPTYHKNGETMKYRSYIPRLCGLPIYLILNILLNLLLLLENLENPLADILPNLVFSFCFLCFFLIFHLKYQGPLAKTILRRVVIFFFFMGKVFFTNTKLLIEITQKPEKIYFKTLVFLFESQTLVGILRPITRLYLAIAGLGYILLNIWIYRGYDLFTVLYGLLSYFTAILLILSGLIEPKKNKKLTQQQKGKNKAIVIKSNNNQKAQVKKTQDSNSLIENAALKAKAPGKMTAEYSSLGDNSAMEVLEKIRESILVIETIENKVRLTNKGFDSLCQSKGVLEPLKLLENAIYQSKEGKEVGFIEVLIDFKEKMLDPLHDAKKLNRKILIKKFNSEDSKSERLKMKLVPIKLNQEDCILILISKTKQNKNVENPEINNQIKELQNNVNSLLKNLEILTLNIVKFIRIDSFELIDICHPLTESLSAPIRPLTAEILTFKFRIFEIHCMNCLDFTSFNRNHFLLGFKNLSPKFFLGEIYQIFKSVVSAYGKHLEINFDELTPDFFQTDYKRLKQTLVILLNRALKTKGSKIVRLLAQSFQLDGHVIIRFTVEDPEISAMELLKAQNFKDASQNEWKSLDLDLVMVQLFASQLGIDPLKLGMKNSPGGITFLVLDKSQQSKFDLPKLPIDFTVNKISQFAKSYSGTEPKNLELLKKNSVTCLEAHESFRNPSGKFLSENNYRFIDDIEPRNQEPALVLLVEPDFIQAFALESALLSSGLQILRAENNKKALELVQSKPDEIKLAIGRVKVISESVKELARRGIKTLGIGREEEKEEVNEKGFKEVIERTETLTRVVRRWLS